ncbi:hypothetical protein B0G77_3660 [Paraburkholderia sp. BL10I2N1]|nr:hypothetical protein B0G77_3660 [Paraburkholderia sp. BL10I2N1]
MADTMRKNTDAATKGLRRRGVGGHRSPPTVSHIVRWRTRPVRLERITLSILIDPDRKVLRSIISSSNRFLRTIRLIQFDVLQCVGRFVRRS